jgi:hypothetical protein
MRSTNPIAPIRFTFRIKVYGGDIVSTVYGTSHTNELAIDFIINMESFQ